MPLGNWNELTGMGTGRCVTLCGSRLVAHFGIVANNSYVTDYEYLIIYFVWLPGKKKGKKREVNKYFYIFFFKYILLILIIFYFIFYIFLIVFSTFWELHN